MAPRPTCDCGDCPKCRRRVYMRDYYRRNADAVRATSRRSRSRRLESAREYDRARGAARKLLIDPMKKRARQYIPNAVYYGRLKRQPCEVCGVEPADAHHEDYSKPKDVRWLCREHHMALHRTVAP